MADTTKPATMRDHWQNALAAMQLSYPAASMLYLQRLTPVSYQAGVLTVAAPDELTRDMGLRLRRVTELYLLATVAREVGIEYVVVDGGVPC